jgi:hypothetical protein
MLITSRSTRLMRIAQMSTPPAHPALPSQDDLDAMWADTLGELVRSHRARLAAPDPSRPWLDGPTRGGHR